MEFEYPVNCETQVFDVSDHQWGQILGIMQSRGFALDADEKLLGGLLTDRDSSIEYSYVPQTGKLSMTFVKRSGLNTCEAINKKIRDVIKEMIG
jgi:hypothetical protein